VPDLVTYTAVLPIGESTIAFVSGLLAGERARRGTRRGRRALGCYRQAILVLRWFLDATRVAQLALDNQISGSTAYRYLPEAIDVLAAVAPSLHGALLAARTAGYSHVHLDGTLIRTDGSRAIGPTAGVDLWWSGKHHHHGGNVQVITAPDGWPLWTSQVRPGREHPSTDRSRCASAANACADGPTSARLGDGATNRTGPTSLPPPRSMRSSAPGRRRPAA
jgi:hypothetical protein